MRHKAGGDGEVDDGDDDDDDEDNGDAELSHLLGVAPKSSESADSPSLTADVSTPENMARNLDQIPSGRRGRPPASPANARPISVNDSFSIVAGDVSSADTTEQSTTGSPLPPPR